MTQNHTSGAYSRHVVRSYNDDPPTFGARDVAALNAVIESYKRDLRAANRRIAELEAEQFDPAMMRAPVYEHAGSPS